MFTTRNHSHDPSGGHFLSGVLFGIAVGAAAGLLLAPHAGADTRHRVAERAGRLRKEAGKRYDDASAAVHDVVDRGRAAWQRGVESLDETRQAREDADAGTPI